MLSLAGQCHELMKTGNTEGRKDGGHTQEGRGKYDILDIKSLKFLCNLQMELSIRQLDICLRSSWQASDRNGHSLVLCHSWSQSGILQSSNLSEKCSASHYFTYLSRIHVQKSHYSKTSTRENKNNEHVSPLAADTNSQPYAKLISWVEIGLLCELWHYMM